MIILNNYKSLVLNGLKAILTLLLIMVLSSPGYSDEYTYTSQNKKSIKNYNSAVSYYQMGDYQNAINSLNKSITIDKNFIEAWLLLGDINADLKKYQDRESLYINTENQLKGAKQIAVDMASAVTKLDRRNQELMKEIDRLTEEVQLLELKIKK